MQHSGDDPYALPDLSTIPRDEWYDALKRLPPDRRLMTVNGLCDEDRRHVMVLTGQLVIDEGERRFEQRSVRPAEPPAASHPPPRLEWRRTRQLNVRLSPNEYARVQQAAKALGLRPVELARWWLADGSRRVLELDDA